MQVPANPPKLSAPIDLERVRQLFSRPQRIAPADFLRREVSSRMFDRLELIKIAPARVLDAGCGTGADLPLLQKSYPAAHVLGLDGAEVPISEGKIDGKNITFKVSLDFGGMPFVISYKGVVSPEEIKMTGSFFEMPFEFVLKKAKP